MIDRMPESLFGTSIHVRYHHVCGVTTGIMCHGLTPVHVFLGTILDYKLVHILTKNHSIHRSMFGTTIRVV